MPSGCGDAPAGFRQIMVEAWAPRPTDRPSFETITQRLDRIQPRPISKPSTPADAPLRAKVEMRKKDRFAYGRNPARSSTQF
jgi:hypothetical protein